MFFLNLLQRAGTGSPVQSGRISAACSTGEEVYTIAIIAEEFRRAGGNSRYLFRITGPDISMRVVHDAARGVYRE